MRLISYVNTRAVKQLASSRTYVYGSAPKESFRLEHSGNLSLRLLFPGLVLYSSKVQSCNDDVLSSTDGVKYGEKFGFSKWWVHETTDV